MWGVIGVSAATNGRTTASEPTAGEPMNTPTPLVLARSLRQLADRLDDEGERAMRRAPILAARGWPVSVNGSEGGRSSDPTSSTERAALNPGPFDGIDYRMRTQLSNLAVSVVLLHASLDTVLTHASDDDPVPVGTGRCLRCDRFCRPDARNPHNRIRAGFCPACDTGWRRAGKPDRGTFIRSYIAEAAG
jgi:hypothetical protein